MDSSKNTKITILKSLKTLLEQSKHPGQTYGGYIMELIEKNAILDNRITTLQAEIDKYVRRRGKYGRFVG